MNQLATIEDPLADPERPAAYALDGRYHDADDRDPDELIEDRTDVPSLAFFPTMARPSGKVAVAPMRLPLIAVVISLLVHINLSLGVYWVMRSLHVFESARLQPMQGDGATASGAIDHGGNGQAPGEAGFGALTFGWSAPQSAAAPALDDAVALDANDAPPPPISAPPPPVPPDPVDAGPTPAPVAADIIVNPLQPELLPVFTRPPPPAVPSATPSRATAPADYAAAATQPSHPPVELASTRPAGLATAPSTALGKLPIGNEAMAAGFSSPASDKAGGLLRHSGAGGSNGKGGAVTGEGGAAVTGRPGSLAGIKGRPLHADYPDDCQRRGETGRVVIEADIRADGSIASLKVISDDRHPQLARAALDAFEGRTFSPALLDGRPIRSTLKCPFVFELRDKREGHE